MQQEGEEELDAMLRISRMPAADIMQVGGDVQGHTAVCSISVATRVVCYQIVRASSDIM
jgi:hypothetical protein